MTTADFKLVRSSTYLTHGRASRASQLFMPIEQLERESDPVGSASFSEVNQNQELKSKPYKTERDPIKQKIIGFVEAFGGVILAMGGIQTERLDLSLVLLFIGLALITAAVWKLNFLETKSLRSQRIFNTFLACFGAVALSFVWGVLRPEQKPPAATRADIEEVREAVKKLRPDMTPKSAASPTIIATPTPSPSAATNRPMRRPRSRKVDSAELRERQEILRALESKQPKHAHATSAQHPRDAITKEGLKEALSKKRTKKGMRFLIEQVKQRGVAFDPTLEYEQELRHIAAKHGNKSLDALIAAVWDTYHRRRREELLRELNTQLIPERKPDWRESDEAKQLAAQMISDVEKLADEGRLIDLTDYDRAIKTYNEWVERCSVTLGRIDILMRRFGRDTQHKFDWDKHDRTWRKLVRDDKVDKQMFRLEVHAAVARLDVIKSKIKLDTLPQVR